MMRILLVEDDTRVASFIRRGLKEEIVLTNREYTLLEFFFKMRSGRWGD